MRWIAIGNLRHLVEPDARPARRFGFNAIAFFPYAQPVAAATSASSSGAANAVEALAAVMPLTSTAAEVLHHYWDVSVSPVVAGGCAGAHLPHFGVWADRGYSTPESWAEEPVKEAIIPTSIVSASALCEVALSPANSKTTAKGRYRIGDFLRFLQRAAYR